MATHRRARGTAPEFEIAAIRLPEPSRDERGLPRLQFSDAITEAMGIAAVAAAEEVYYSALEGFHDERRRREARGMRPIRRVQARHLGGVAE